MRPYLAGLISRTLCSPWPCLTVFHASLGQWTLVYSCSRSWAAPLVARLRVHLLSLMLRVPTLWTCLSLGRGAWHMLTGRGRGVGLFRLSPRLRVGNWLCCLDLDAEPGPGGGWGCGVGGWDWLRVGLRGWRWGVVVLVGGGVLRRLVLTGVGGHWVVLALGMRGVAHGWPTLRRHWALVCRLVMIPWEVFVVRHIVVQLWGGGGGSERYRWQSSANKMNRKLSWQLTAYLCAGVLWVAVQVSQHTGEGVDISIDFGVIVCRLFRTTVLTAEQHKKHGMNQNMKRRTLKLTFAVAADTHHQLVAVHVWAPGAVFFGTTWRGVVVITRRMMNWSTFGWKNTSHPYFQDAPEPLWQGQNTINTLQRMLWVLCNDFHFYFLWQSSLNPVFLPVGPVAMYLLAIPPPPFWS